MSSSTDDGAPPTERILTSSRFTSSRISDGVLHFTLERPEASNALNDEMWADLARVLDAADSDGSIRAVVLRGRGRSFCGGEDRTRLERLQSRESAQLQLQHNLATIRRLAELSKPVVSIVDGAAHGIGMLLVLATDYAVATERATLCLPESRLGIVDSVNTPGLTGWLGPMAAKSLVLLGSTVDARAALRWGLVSDVAPHLAGAEDAARAALARMLEVPPHTYEALKQIVMAAHPPGSQDLLVRMLDFGGS